MADLSKLVDELSTLTVLEAAELAKMLEEKWGVSAAAAVAVAGPAAGGGAAAPPSKSRPSSRSCWPPPATRRSRSSRKSARSPASASRKPRTWSKARPRPSRKACQGRSRQDQGPAREGWRQGRAQVMRRAACGAHDHRRGLKPRLGPGALRPGPSCRQGARRDVRWSGADDGRQAARSRGHGRRSEAPWCGLRECQGADGPQE